MLAFFAVRATLRSSLAWPGVYYLRSQTIIGQRILWVCLVVPHGLMGISMGGHACSDRVRWPCEGWNLSLQHTALALPSHEAMVDTFLKMHGVDIRPWV